MHVEDRAQRGFFVAGHVAVPVFSGHMLRRLVSLDHQDFRMAGQLLRRVRMNVQLAKAPPERLVLLHRHGLIAEEDDEIFHQCVVNLLKLLVAQIPGEVHSENLCADHGIEFAHFDRLVSHQRPSCFL